VTLITRLRMDVALYKPAPPYTGFGRPRRKGARLPTPQQYLHAPATGWTTITVSWYDDQQRTLEIVSQTAAGCSSAIPWANWIPVPCFALPKRLLPNTLCPGSSGVGVSKSPLKKPALTLASNPSASGRTWRLRAPLLPCLACFPGSPLSLISFNLISLSRFVVPPGIRNPFRLSPMPSPWRVKRFGPVPRLFPCHPLNPTAEIPRPLLDSFLNTLRYAA
jgi:hypothetical protein